jgi:hypothetical protein
MKKMKTEMTSHNVQNHPLAISFEPVLLLFTRLFVDPASLGIILWVSSTELAASPALLNIDFGVPQQPD